MSHKDVYAKFELYFPEYAGDRTEIWFPNGKNSIRVRQTNKQEFIFTFHEETDWKFETIKSFFRK